MPESPRSENEEFVMTVSALDPRRRMPLPPSRTNAHPLMPNDAVPSATMAAVSAKDQSPPDGARKGRSRNVACDAVSVSPLSVTPVTGAVALPVKVTSRSTWVTETTPGGGGVPADALYQRYRVPSPPPEDGASGTQSHSPGASSSSRMPSTKRAAPKAAPRASCQPPRPKVSVAAAASSDAMENCQLPQYSP